MKYRELGKSGLKVSAINAKLSRILLSGDRYPAELAKRAGK